MRKGFNNSRTGMEVKERERGEEGNPKKGLDP